MTVEHLDHYSVRTKSVDTSVVFYENALNLCSGLRPMFKFPGAWLYRKNQNGDTVGSSVVHIVGVDSHDEAGLIDYLGDKSSSLEAGSGSLDHIAFVASNIVETYTRLRRYQIGFRERKVPNMDLHQIFIEDPDGITIELNYSGPDDVLEGRRSLETLKR